MLKLPPALKQQSQQKSFTYLHTLFVPNWTKEKRKKHDLQQENSIIYNSRPLREQWEDQNAPITANLCDINGAT